jgi:hypothetical protein
MHRIYLAFLCFFRILFGRPLPAEVVALPPAELTEKEPPGLPPKAEPAPAVAPAAAAPAAPRKKADVSPGALQLLALFQREGRLIDFLSEEIDAYDDASIGAAVRDIHKGCKKVLAEHFGVEPVLDADEDEAISVDSGFDPARVRLIGNVAGLGPWKGTLRHHGWRAAKVTLPSLSEGHDVTIVAPAEVEL